MCHVDEVLYFHVALQPHHKHSGSITGGRILFLRLMRRKTVCACGCWERKRITWKIVVVFPLLNHLAASLTHKKTLLLHDMAVTYADRLAG